MPEEYGIIRPDHHSHIPHRHSPHKMNTSSEIARGSAKLRLWAFIALGIIAVMGLAALIYLPDFLREIELISRNSMVDATDSLSSFIMSTSLVLSLITVAVGIYLGGLAMRTLNERRFPPLGAQVIKDTRIVTGDPARRKGRIILVIAILVLVSAIVIPVAMWQITMLFVEGIVPISELN